MYLLHQFVFDLIFLLQVLTRIAAGMFDVVRLCRYITRAVKGTSGNITMSGTKTQSLMDNLRDLFTACHFLALMDKHTNSPSCLNSHLALSIVVDS